MSDIKHRDLTVTQRSFCLDRLAEANRPMRRWARFFGKRKIRWLRDRIFAEAAEAKKRASLPEELRKEFDAKRKAPIRESIPEELRDEFDASVRVLLKIRQEPVAILDGRTIEAAMIEGFLRFIHKYTAPWSSVIEDGCGDEEDLLQEGLLAAIDTIYAYTDRSIQFTSLLHKTVRNRMISRANSFRPTCPLSNKDRQLLTSFSKEQVAANGPISFDEVANRLGLTDDEQLTLSRMLTKVQTESQFQVHESTKDWGRQDYTAERRDLPRNLSLREKVLHSLIKDAIQQDLSDFERIVLEASLNNPTHGWKASVARDHLNPRTGRPYTRMGVGMALQAAIRKIKSRVMLAAA